jgi:Protein of unknown function (DUF3224)
MARAEGTFSVTSWDEDTYQKLDGKAKLTKATVGYHLSGDIEGHATWAAVMCYKDDGTAEYTGIQHLTGRIGGREGTCVMVADGTFADGEARGGWRVIEGSGTGALAGLRGSGSSVAAGGPGGTYVLDYEFG